MKKTHSWLLYIVSLCASITNVGAKDYHHSSSKSEHFVKSHKTITTRNATKIEIESVDPNHLSQLQQAHLFEGMKKFGIYYNNPYTWQHLQDPKLVVAEIYSCGEPLDSYRLDALERISPELMKTRSYETLQASALLYRYGRPNGDAQLSALILDSTQPNFAAATIYALNQDDRKINPIINILTVPSQSNNTGYIAQSLLIQALGKWHNPKIADALWKAYQNAPEEADQLRFRKTDYILALAQQESMSKALPSLRHLYFGSVQGSQTHAYSGAAIVKIDPSNTDQIFNELLTEMASKPNAPVFGNRHDVIVAFGALKITRSVPALEAIIHSYLADPSSQSSQNDQDNVVEAAKSLVEMDARDAEVIVTKLLLQYSKEKVADAYKAQSAEVILSFGRPDGKRVVSQVMGKEWLKTELLQRGLKPISDYLIPANRASQ